MAEPESVEFICRNIPCQFGVQDHVTTIRNALALVVPVALLLLGFPGSAQTWPKSSAANSYELTAWAGYDINGFVSNSKVANPEGLKIHAFVKADAPFVLTSEDGQGNRLRISGTVREIDTRDFYLDNAQLTGFGMSMQGRMCGSKETMETRKALQPFLGPEARYNPNDPPEADTGGWCCPLGPGCRINLKRRHAPVITEARVFGLPSPPPQLIITPAAGNVILTWPTVTTGFALQSTTNLGSSAIWTTNSPVPVVVNGQYTVTNPISGTLQFFRFEPMMAG